MNLWSRLFVLVAVALLPAIAIQAYNELDLVQARQLEVQKQVISLAKNTAAEQQQIVQGIRQLLIALSEFPAIKARDGATCNAYLSAMKDRFPAFLTFHVADVNGMTFCDSTGGTNPINVSGRRYFFEAIRNEAFTVGEFSIGLALHRKVIVFALPFSGEDGQLGGLVLAGLSLDWLADYLGRMGGSDGAAIALTDRNGTYLARYPLNEQFVGRKAPDEPHREVGDRSVDTIDVDGVGRIIGYSPLKESGGLVVSYGLDKARAFMPIRTRTLRDVFLIILSVSMILAGTWLGGRRFIQRPLGQMFDAANQWRRGEYAKRVALQGSRDVARVAEAFNFMADALEQRERELLNAKENAERAACRITMIFESTTDSVIIVDHDFKISYLNGRALTDIAEERNLIGVDLVEALGDAATNGVFDQLRRCMIDGQPRSLETLCPGRNLWFEINAFPSDRGLAIYFRDITEHKQALEARRLAEEKLHQSQKMESIGQLTGGIAHDFNNLLTVVSGNLELIEEIADDARIQRSVAAARGATDRGAKLTAQLLAFSRRQNLKPRLVNINRLISEFQGLMRQAVGGGCEVNLRTDEQLWLCNVDPQLLEVALLNLALNGRDAMANGGALVIETRNVAAHDCSAEGGLPGPYVRLTVADTGCGMLPEVRDRIFEPFFTTKEVGRGTGLGLSMVYGFVEQSGGHIEVETAPGKGTTIAVYLPRVSQEPDAEVDTIQPSTILRGTERLLVVEDNEDILEVTSSMLRRSGYQVSCACSGRAALQALSDQKFDLLFSDVVMPTGVSGVELAYEARRLDKDIKVLLTSGFLGDKQQRHVNEFPTIDKPYRHSDLARRLRAILDGAEL